MDAAAGRGVGVMTAVAAGRRHDHAKRWGLCIAPRWRSAPAQRSAPAGPINAPTSNGALGAGRSPTAPGATVRGTGSGLLHHQRRNGARLA